MSNTEEKTKGKWRAVGSLPRHGGHVWKTSWPRWEQGACRDNNSNMGTKRLTKRLRGEHGLVLTYIQREMQTFMKLKGEISVAKPRIAWWWSCPYTDKKESNLKSQIIMIHQSSSDTQQEDTVYTIFYNTNPSPHACLTVSAIKSERTQGAEGGRCKVWRILVCI